MLADWNFSGMFTTDHVFVINPTQQGLGNFCCCAYWTTHFTIGGWKKNFTLFSFGKRIYLPIAATTSGWATRAATLTRESTWHWIQIRKSTGISRKSRDMLEALLQNLRTIGLLIRLFFLGRWDEMGNYDVPAMISYILNVIDEMNNNKFSRA